MLREIDNASLTAINLFMLVMILALLGGFKALSVLAVGLTPVALVGLVLLSRGHGV